MEDRLPQLKMARGGTSPRGSAQPAITLLAPSSLSIAWVVPGLLVRWLEELLAIRSHKDPQGTRAKVDSRNFLERKWNLFSQKLLVNFSSHLIGLNLVS